MRSHKKRTSQFTIRVTEDLHEQLRVLAEKDGRPLASYVSYLLQQHVDAKQLEAGRKVE